MSHRAVTAALVVLTIMLAVVTFAGVAVAQGAQATAPAAQEPTFPTGLGYAALALAGSAGATMAAVIRHLWKRLGAKDQDIKDLVQVHGEALATAESERRVEAEKLLREQQVLLREVMTNVTSYTDEIKQLRLELAAVRELLEEE